MTLTIEIHETPEGLVTKLNAQGVCSHRENLHLQHLLAAVDAALLSCPANPGELRGDCFLKIEPLPRH